MTVVIIFLVLLGVASGPLLARVKQDAVRRLEGWLLVVAGGTAAHVVLLGSDPIARMVGICCVLLGTMKGLVYAEWAREHRLPLHRYLVFSFAWFGMDPGTFRVRRKGLSWRGDLVRGIALMIVGTLGAWLVWAMEWRQIFVMFLPMSLGFHFGALRVLKAGLRAAGFPVRTLFPNLLEAQGVGDFWSKRWNVGYSQMMQRVVGRPIEAKFGSSAGLMAVFVASGLLHELAITLPVQSGYGLPTAYFVLHGVLALTERARGRSFGKVFALLATMVPLGMLFPRVFQEEVIARCLQVFAL
jgi:hypothetical protein